MKDVEKLESWLGQNNTAKELPRDRTLWIDSKGTWTNIPVLQIKVNTIISKVCPWAMNFNRLYTIDAYKRQYVKPRQTLISVHGCAWTLLQPWALSNKLCIWSVVRVGHPLVNLWGFIRKPSKGRGIASVRSRVGCRSTRSWKWLTGHVFFSTPMKRVTRLATEVHRTSGFIKLRQLCGYVSLLTRKAKNGTQLVTIGAPQKVGFR